MPRLSPEQSKSHMTDSVAAEGERYVLECFLEVSFRPGWLSRGKGPNCSVMLS